MIFVYTRHIPDCDHTGDIKYRRCRCPKWIDGYTNGKRVRQSAGTRSWEQAERKARLIEDAGDPSKVLTPAAMTITDAVGAYLGDEKSRNLSKETTKQSRTLFEKHFLSWAKHRGLGRLTDVTPPELVNFRSTWGNNGLTANRKLSRLVGFFAFCHETEACNGRLDSNRLVPQARIPENRRCNLRLWGLAWWTRFSLSSGPPPCFGAADALVGLVHPRCGDSGTGAVER